MATLVRSMKTFARSQVGEANVAAVTGVVFGVIVIVIGLVLADTILTRAATSGSSANIGSFSGARAMNDLVPLVYYAAVVGLGVGIMILGFRTNLMRGKG